MAVVSELRWASVLARVTDGNYLAGAKTDSLLIDFDHLDAGFYADPQSAVYPDRDIDSPRRG